MGKELNSNPGGSAGKESACNEEAWVRSLGWEDSLEKGMATHSNIFAWRIPWTEEPGRPPQSRGSQSRTWLRDFNFQRYTNDQQAHEKMLNITNHSVQLSSVAQSCPTLCDPMNHSTPGLPVHHKLLEFTQVHRVGDAIQPSHPLSSPSPPAPNLSQHQGLFLWVNSSHEVAKVLEFREMQIKTTRYHLTLTRMATIKELNNSKCW